MALHNIELSGLAVVRGSVTIEADSKEQAKAIAKHEIDHGDWSYIAEVEWKYDHLSETEMIEVSP